MRSMFEFIKNFLKIIDNSRMTRRVVRRLHTNRLLKITV